MDVTIEELIDTLDVALDTGDWVQVLTHTVPLQEALLAMGETTLAQLVNDLHAIAQDALAHPVLVAQVLAP